MDGKRKALGKGLTALLSDAATDVTGKITAPVNTISEIAISEIEANPFQPRENFDEEGLEELVQSIQKYGIIQPVTVRKIGYGKYQLISGERRTRASIRAGLKTIPAYIRLSDDQGMLTMSMIENLHRDDLNPIEVAIGYRRMIEECQLTQEEVAKNVGKNRTNITNFLRLLKLPEEIQIALRDNKISMGHARPLITLENKAIQIQLLDEIVENELSVRQVEEMIKKLNNKPVKNKKVNKEKLELKNELFDHVAEKLADIYHTTVRIKPKNKGKGEIIINYNSQEDLQRISSLIDKYL
jgi:ParB family transcriptional regulator, chromosome partitioning protein